MKSITVKIFFLVTLCHIVGKNVNAQSNGTIRLILIGDAGRQNSDQQTLLSSAAINTLPNKTIAIFLGDNVYPRGFENPTTKEGEESRKIIESQYKPFVKNNTPVFFVPGNHDYDKSGKAGWQKMNWAHDYFDSIKYKNVQFVPKRNCPDPTIIYNDSAVCVVGYDSEWLLFQKTDTASSENCHCNNKAETIAQLSSLAIANKHKQLIIVSHHPFISFGPHAGYFSIKDHIFPLTNVKKNLYIPLPIIGSLYPFLRNTFLNIEDIKHPKYQEIKTEIEAILKNHGNAIHAAGHEHSLQLYQNEYTALVSGAGANKSFVKKNNRAAFVSKTYGYAIVDIFENKEINIAFWGAENDYKSPLYQKTIFWKKQNPKTVDTALLQDSILVSANKTFSKKSVFHQKIFGENYRESWSTANTLPYIKISQIYGGLIPTARGGGQQSKSLRLRDKHNNEWVIRSVNKYPDVILPKSLRKGLAKDVLYDAMSAQHPYSALVVPTLCKALSIPSATPIIGVIAPDTLLGNFANDFVNTVCLLEQREPLPNSISTQKMFAELIQDNDNKIDAGTFLKARLLDFIIGDWDRHQDQWRWAVEHTKKGKFLIPIPRDRDQVFHVMQGLIPRITTSNFVAPKLHNFTGKYKNLFAFFTNGANLNAQLLSSLNAQDWLQITQYLKTTLSDTVLSKALSFLPAETYAKENAKLLSILKQRRDELIKVSSSYYNFLNKNVEVVLSNKNEYIKIETTNDKKLLISIFKITKAGKIGDSLYCKNFDDKITKSINIYTYSGYDSIIIDNQTKIKIRIAHGKGDKPLQIMHAKRKIQLYAKKQKGSIEGLSNRARYFLNKDSSEHVYTFNNPYNVVAPIIAGGYNIDDGLLLGGGIAYTKQGFKKTPFASFHKFSFQHALATKAFNFSYNSQWQTRNKNINLQAKLVISAPNNTQNFFGAGNNSRINSAINNKLQYYRARFNIYDAGFYINKQLSLTSNIKYGIQAQHYQLKLQDTINRFIANKKLLNTYDSSLLEKSKTYVSATVSYNISNIRKQILPKNGASLTLQATFNKGLNAASNSYIQCNGSFTFYKSLDINNKLVIANRLGGGFTFGNATFFQQLFLGGHENLLGYRRFRFSGQSVVYNNTELRVRIKELTSYVFSGELGCIGFYDIGRVWLPKEKSNLFHSGIGTGFYFAPSNLVVIQALAGFSKEGVLPYITLGMRF